MQTQTRIGAVILTDEVKAYRQTCRQLLVVRWSIMKSCSLLGIPAGYQKYGAGKILRTMNTVYSIHGPQRFCTFWKGLSDLSSAKCGILVEFDVFWGERFVCWTLASKWHQFTDIFSLPIQYIAQYIAQRTCLRSMKVPQLEQLLLLAVLLVVVL